MLDRDQLFLLLKEGFEEEDIEAHIGMFRRLIEEVEGHGWLMIDVMYVIHEVATQGQRIEVIPLLYWLLADSEEFQGSPITHMRDQGFRKGRTAVVAAAKEWKQALPTEEPLAKVVDISAARSWRRNPR